MDQAPLLEAREHKGAKAEDALCGKVVDGEVCRDLCVRAVRVHAVEQVRYERGEPIMDVDDVREEFQRRQHLQQSA